MRFGKANVPDQGGNNIFELVFLVTLGTNETNLTIKGEIMNPIECVYGLVTVSL